MAWMLWMWLADGGMGAALAGDAGWQVEVLSPRRVVVDVGEPVLEAGPWQVMDGSGARVGPVETLRWIDPTGLILDESEELLVSDRRERVLLELGEKLVEGEPYRLSMGGVGLDWTLDSSQPSPAVQINQVGFLDGERPRYAYAGSALPGLDASDPSGHPWEVVDESGEVVLSGEWQLRATPEDAEDVLGRSFGEGYVAEADISALEEPGEYRLVWPGVGSSATFVIADDAYVEPFVTAFRALYHQRCGQALSPELTDWSHEACHVDPVWLSDADAHVAGSVESMVSSATGESILVLGGHHAGEDYRREVSQLVVVHDLVDLVELFPAAMARDDLGLPESDNGIPDLLDEALYALQPYAGLRESLGGVPAQLVPHEAASPTLAPSEHASAVYASAADAHSTYLYVAAAAALGRALDEVGEEDLGDDWVDEAEQAFKWAEEQRAGGELIYSVDDAAALAAAELLRSTGDDEHAEVFREVMPFPEELEELDPFSLDAPWLRPCLAYRAADAGAEEEVVATCEQLLITRAEVALGWADQSAYRLAVDPEREVGQGSLSVPSRAGLLLRVHAFTGDAAYLHAAEHSVAAMLGSNWTGRSWMTGVGSEPVRAPYHPPSLALGLEEPVPGMVVYGPSEQQAGSAALELALGVVQPAIESWPLAARYLDVGLVPELGGVSVERTLSPAIFALGYLAAQAEPEAEEEPEDTEGGDEEEPPGPPGPQGEEGRPGPATVDTGAGAPPAACGCAAGGPTGLWLTPGCLGLLLLRRRRELR